MKNIVTLLCLSLIILSIGCKKENENENENENKEYNISGKAQKGPFLPGANVTISELDEDLNPTGKSYFTTVMDNNGSFTFPNVTFASNFIQLKVEGNLYYEYLNCGSGLLNSEMTLFGIADISQAGNKNINILTHLEMDRIIKYKHDGYSFAEAEELAQKEVLKIFNLENISCQGSENLDISNGILLALSIIISGSTYGPSLVGILTNIRNDLNDNGILDDTNLQKRLISQAKYISVQNITKNLNSFYTANGINSTVPQFESYIETFIDQSTFTSTADYSFPQFSPQGINILYFTNDTILIDTAQGYSMSFQTYANTNINVQFILTKISGSGSWIASNNQNWVLEDSYGPNVLWGNLVGQPSTLTDISLHFHGKGIANLQFNNTLNIYQMDLPTTRYIKWGY